MSKKAHSSSTLGGDRPRQVARAQSLYREKKRGDGFQRLQEWLPEATSLRLKYLCDATGLTKREALVRLISAADVDKIESGRSEK